MKNLTVYEYTLKSSKKYGYRFEIAFQTNLQNAKVADYVAVLQEGMDTYLAG